SYQDDDGQTNAGAIYILFLNADGTVKSKQKISNLDGGLGSVLGNTELFGASIANIGDLNGDGITDLAVGSSGSDDGYTNAGAVWILFMNANGTVKSKQKISATVGGFGGILNTNCNFGGAITSLGDLDGDGIQDLAVGADGNVDSGLGGMLNGAVWILLMNADGTVKGEQKISATDGNFNGGLAYDDKFGSSVENIGDLNNDGIVDLAVGAKQDDDGNTNTGAVWILFMNTDGTVNSEVKISDTSGNFEGVLGGADYFGYAVQYIGDIDGDGLPTLMVSARLDDDGGTDKGAVWLLNLNTDGTVKTYQKISATQGGFSGNLTNADFFGSSIALIGDLDNDSYPEIAIGAIGDDEGGTDRGAVYMMTLNKNTASSSSSSNGSAAHRSAADMTRNWSYRESYDENGKIIGMSKQYVDELGRNTQSLTLNIDKNRVLAAQTVYDKYGRPVVNTLPAPIGSNMGYRENFMTNTNGDNYSYADFDEALTLNNPNAVQNTTDNTLGSYYSDNGEEDYVATSSYPFSRVEYMADPTGRVKRSAAPGENFKMGSGNESKVFYMYTGGELDRAFGEDSSFYCKTSPTNRLESTAVGSNEIIASKTISVDAEGKIAISFTSDGLTVASCVSGMTPTPAVPEQSVYHTMLSAGTQSVDIHLPQAKSTTLTFPLPNYPIPLGSGDDGIVDANEINYTIIDLESNVVLALTTDYTIDASTRAVTFLGTNKHRFLRIAYNYTATKLTFF
ncbi:MAG: FG-GAP repeat protein, partial [Psychroserpens sp.]|nr:FG-GAP repeat protein [Psychroserpens sp.]